METSHGYQAITSQNVLSYNCLLSTDHLLRCHWLPMPILKEFAIRLTVHHWSSELGQCDCETSAKFCISFTWNIPVITWIVPGGLFFFLMRNSSFYLRVTLMQNCWVVDVVLDLTTKMLCSLSSHRLFGCELKRNTTAALKGSTRRRKKRKGKKQGAPAEAWMQQLFWQNSAALS